MKKRKGNPLYRMIAVLLSVVLVVEMPQGADSVNVLAKERVSENTAESTEKETEPEDTESTEKETEPEDTESIGKESDPEDTESTEKETDPEDTESTEKETDPEDMESTEKESDPEDTESAGEETDPEDVGETVSGNDARPDDETEMQEVMQAAEVAVQADFIATGTDWELDADGKLTIKSDAGMRAWNRIYYGKQVISVEIQEGVTSIGESAFYGCSSLTDIEIPSSVTSIGVSAFTGCKSLTDIEIPLSVTSMGNYVFKGCSSLTNITIPTGVTSIGKSAFYGCSSLTDIEIPLSVTTIAGSTVEGTFEGCSSLTNITIPTGVTEIGDRVFYGCSSLTDITIPTGVTEIGEYAFAACSRLTNITISSGVTSIGEAAFRNCSSLTGITIPSSVTNIKGFMFDGCSSLRDIEIPTGVTEIGEYAFRNCSSLTSITIPSSVTSIGQHAFEGCSCNGLTNITIPSGVTSIEGYVFKGCSSLTDITIPAGVTGVGQHAFEDCSSLRDIEIPTGVTRIGEYAFRGCRSLTDITMPTGVTEIGEYAFNGCISLTDITIPAGVTNIGSCAFAGCSSLTTDIEIPTGVTEIRYSTFSGCSSLTNITIPMGVTYINTSAFDGCSSLTNITIPTSVTGIGEYTFEGCSSFTSITIPTSVTRIGWGAFRGCRSLTSVTLQGATPPLLEDKVFYNCKFVTDKIKGIYVPAESIDAYKAQWEEWANYITYNIAGTDWTLDADGKLTIQSDAGMADWSSSGRTPYGTLVISVEIQEGVTSIGDSAFNGCSSLTSITMLPTTPPTLDGNAVFTSCKFVTDNTKGIHVPVGTAEAYKRASGWSAYRNYITDGAPEITTQPMNQSVKNGEEVTFFVTATGTGEPFTYQWQVDQNDGNGFADINNATSSTYTISAVNKGCNGYRYRCVITNEIGSVTSDAAELTVIDSDADKVAAAKEVVQEVLAGYMATNADTGQDIQNKINKAVNEAGITDVTVTVKDFIKKEATEREEGSIGGSIVIRCGNESGIISIDKTIDKLPDEDPPTGAITIETSSWTDLLNTVTFELFFKETKQAMIKALDTGSGVDKTYYYVSDRALSEAEVKALGEGTWKEGDSVSISPDRKCVIYAKITDKAGNIVYLSSDGLVFDGKAPVISGVTDGEIYRTPQTVTVTDENLESVKVDGMEVVLNDGQFTLEAVSGAQTITATDRAGNTTAVTVTVKTEEENVADIEKIVEDTLEEVPVTEDTTAEEIMVAIIATLAAAGITGLIVEVMIAAAPEAGMASVSAFVSGAGGGIGGGMGSSSGGGSESNIKEIRIEKEKELHTHKYGILWKSDSLFHWHECSCGAKAGKIVHCFGEWKVTKPATENEEGAKERICVICGRKDSEKIPKTTHTHSYGSEWMSDDTNHWHECECGAKAEEAVHSFEEWTIRKAATADEYGIKERICVICRYKEIEVIPKNTHSHSYGSEWKSDGANHWHECRVCKAKAEEAAHSFGEWTIIKPATADEYGVKERMCAVCGYTETEIISKTTHTHSYGIEWEYDSTNHWHECSECGAKAEEAVHSFGEWTVRKRATEDEYGIKERECAVCNYKETKVIPKTTHSHSYGIEWKYDGANHWHECSDCGAKVEKAVHSYGEWTVKKTATADEYGVQERICAVCQYKETEVIPKTTHSHSYGIEWKYDGANHWHECSDCGAKAEEAVHSYGEWTVKKTATADEYGVQERICAVCQYKETEVIPNTSHSHSYGIEWEYDGISHWHECSSCGAKVEKDAHSFGVWMVKKNATAHEYGVRERICVVCKYRETEVIPNTTHRHSYGSEWKFDGTKHWRECRICGAKAEKATHSFGAWMVIKSATADEYGVKDRICVVCQYRETEVIPSTTHVHSYGSEWEYDGANHWHKCSVCRAKAEVSVHSYGEWTVKKTATADEYGVKDRICAVCKYKETVVIPSTTHVHSYGSEWEYDGTNHWHECSSCGAKAEEAAHSYGEWTVKKPATGEEEGIRDRICAVCKYKETEVIPIITQGYSYGSIPDQTYTGLSIKLSEDVLKIYYGTTRLTAGVDYSVSYKNNKAIGTATVTIKGKGNYRETETIQFNIVPKNIADTDVEITYNEYVESNTKEQRPLSKITYNGKKLTTKDYEVEYYKLENNQKTGNALKGIKEAGDYQMVITGMKNYTGTVTETIHVVADGDGTFMNTLKITLKYNNAPLTSIVYTGIPIEPKVEVTDRDGTPVAKENYCVSFSNNTNVGTANVIITGEPDNGYYGSVTKTFKITGTVLSSAAKVSTEGWQSKVAIDPVSGTAEQPSASLVPKRSSDPELAEGIDYTVSYSNNTRPGTATVTFTGMGRYTGSLKKTFKVTAVAWTKADLENETLTVDVNNTAPFAKKGAQPAVTVTYKNMKLTAGRDYKVTYSNNKAVTTASTKKKSSVTIVGMGIYSGTIKDAKEFTIEKADLATVGITLTVRDAVYSGQNGSFISKPVVKEADGTILTEGANKDYTVKYSVVENGVETEKTANDAALDKNTIVKVTVSAASDNYTGSISKEYKVVAASIRSATIIARAQTYTGKEITLSAADFSKARIGKTPLVYDVDYEIVPGSYERNINKGNATVTIRGIGNYGDEKKVTFRITSAALKWWSDLFA